MFIINNYASFDIRCKESLVKQQRFSKYYENDSRYLGFPTSGQLVGPNLDKMDKICMEITKSTLLSQNSERTWGHGGTRQLFG